MAISDKDLQAWARLVYLNMEELGMPFGEMNTHYTVSEDRTLNIPIISGAGETVTNPSSYDSTAGGTATVTQVNTTEVVTRMLYTSANRKSGWDHMQFLNKMAYDFAVKIMNMMASELPTTSPLELPAADSFDGKACARLSGKLRHSNNILCLNSEYFAELQASNKFQFNPAAEQGIYGFSRIIRVPEALPNNMVGFTFPRGAITMATSLTTNEVESSCYSRNMTIDALTGLTARYFEYGDPSVNQKQMSIRMNVGYNIPNPLDVKILTAANA